MIGNLLTLLIVGLLTALRAAPVSSQRSALLQSSASASSSGRLVLDDAFDMLIALLAFHRCVGESACESRLFGDVEGWAWMMFYYLTTTTTTTTTT